MWNSVQWKKCLAISMKNDRQPAGKINIFTIKKISFTWWKLYSMILAMYWGNTGIGIIGPAQPLLSCELVLSDAIPTWRMKKIMLSRGTPCEHNGNIEKFCNSTSVRNIKLMYKLNTIGDTPGFWVVTGSLLKT